MKQQIVYYNMSDEDRTELLSKHATLHLAVAVVTLAHIDRQTDRQTDT